MEFKILLLWHVTIQAHISCILILDEIHDPMCVFLFFLKKTEMIYLSQGD